MKFVRSQTVYFLRLSIFFAFFLPGKGATAQANDLNLIAKQFLRQSLAEKLNLNPQYLKLYPGSEVIGSRSQWMWNIFNAIPPKDSLFYDPTQVNNFAEEYGYIVYRVKTNQAKDSCDKNAAILKYFNPFPHSYAWNKTIEDLQESLVNGQPLLFDLDTIIQGIDPKTEIFWSDTIAISFKFEKTVVFYAQPYSEKDTLNPVLDEYNPWYLPCFIKKVYTNSNEYYLTAKDWEYFFGKRGTVHSQTAALFVGYKGLIYLSVNSGYGKLFSLTTFDEPVILGVVVYPFGEMIK